MGSGVRSPLEALVFATFFGGSMNLLKLDATYL